MKHRIVSLIPSATEIVAAIERLPDLVARSHECDFPPEVIELPVVSRPSIRIDGSSRQIDDEVRARLTSALSIYKLDEQLLAELRPTVIVTQSQCEVCAVSLQDVEQAVAKTVWSQPKIVSLRPMQLSDLWDDIATVATAIDATAAALSLVATLQRRLTSLTNAAQRAEHTRPRVLCIEWLDPLMVAGNWVPQLVELAGGEAILATVGSHSPFIAWEDVLAAAPEVVVLMPCGFTIARSLQEVHLLTERRGWDQLPATRTGNVFVTDGHHYSNRPGPRLVDSAEILFELLHPDHPRDPVYQHAWQRIAAK